MPGWTSPCQALWVRPRAIGDGDGRSGTGVDEIATASTVSLCRIGIGGRRLCDRRLRLRNRLWVVRVIVATKDQKADKCERRCEVS